MFGQLQFVRLRAAEKALRENRLDEAYRLAGAPDLREQRRGAAVLNALAEKFIQRARTHFRSDRFAEALADLQRAETGNTLKDEIAELRAHIQTVITAQARHDEHRHERVTAAKKRIEGGSLTAGRKILEQASRADQAAHNLKRIAEQKADDATRVIDQAAGLIKQGRYAAAAQRVRRAKSLCAHDQQLSGVENDLCNHVFKSARNALVEGRLGRAADELECLDDLGNKLPAKRELLDAIATAWKATDAVREHRYGEARKHVMQLARLIPAAKWIKIALDHLQRLSELKAELAGGPLGEQVTPPHTHEPCLRHSSPDDTVALPVRGGLTDSRSGPLLLLVDGGGSYLIIRSERPSIGRANSTKPADVPLISDIAERHANIARVDDDYFLFSHKAVDIAGTKSRQHLLRDGDRIVLDRKAKFTFRLPSRKSATAVLDLSDTTKMPNDVRRVVLFHRHATVGNGRGAHIACRHAGVPLILFERDGSLWLRQKNDGHVSTEAIQLPIGTPIEFAGVGMALQPWRIQSPGGSVRLS